MSEPQTADPTVEAAVAHHRAGRLAEAEQGYRTALAADPTQARAAHNLGVLLQGRQQLDEAIRWFAAATEADPQGTWWTSQVRALTRAGRYQAAEDVLRRRGEQSPEAHALEVDLRQRYRELDARTQNIEEALIELRQVDSSLQRTDRL